MAPGATLLNFYVDPNPGLTLSFLLASDMATGIRVPKPGSTLSLMLAGTIPIRTRSLQESTIFLEHSQASEGQFGREYSV